MKPVHPYLLAPLLFIAAEAMLSNTNMLIGGEEKTSDVNIAVVAAPSTSYVSGDTTLAALNNGFDPRSSQDRSKRSYGNWPRRGTQWVQYEWDRAIAADRIDVYWWNDRRGVRNPKACRILYWKNGSFAPVENAEGLGVAESTYNTTTFDEVRTTRLRLEIDSTERYSTGILEWKVYDSGNSPDFPPVAEAGIDRAVLLGGKTYLAGSIKTLKQTADVRTQWKSISGPGGVTFENDKALSTTASFSKTGDYVLELTGRTGKLEDSATLKVKVQPDPPQTNLTLIDPIPYTITNPLWFRRAKAIIVNWIPHCIEKINDPGLREGGINNLIDAADKLAGKPHSRHRGYVFSNAWIFNTVESICMALLVDPRGDKEIIKAQNKMKRTLEEWIPLILAAQEPDGYLQTSFTLSGRERWTPRHRGAHEGYVAGYFLEAGMVHYIVTGYKDARLYDAAKKLADCWNRHIGPPPKQKWYNGHQGMELALVRFGRFVNKAEGEGKGDKYINLAKFLLDCREGGNEYDQSHVPVVRQYEAVGHAVRASYSYAGMADVAMETGDIDYHSAVASLWDNIVNRKYYVTGGIGSGETSEGFGPDYSLRDNAYCESCSSCGEIFFQHRLHLTYHEAKYADLYEETLYNALLGSLDLEGKNFYYQNPLTTHNQRYPWHGCPCCVGNIPRTLLSLPTWTYAKTAGSIYINLFTGSRMTISGIAGTDVTMEQETDYPFRGDVAITVNPAVSRKFSIRIRIPDRSVSELYANTPEADGIKTIRLNGSSITPKTENGYTVVTRTWKKGDTIKLKLPMTIQRVKGIGKIEATRGRVALRYGPLVYAFENVDQEPGKTLAPDAELTAEWKPDLLGGVMVIKGKWSDGSPLTAIPYYARSNRLPAQAEGNRRRRTFSTVWVKDQ